MSYNIIQDSDGHDITSYGPAIPEAPYRAPQETAGRLLSDSNGQQATEDMRPIKEAILAEQDFSLDLVEFEVEGQMNDYYAGKKLPQRITCHWADEQRQVMRIELRGYVQAVFTRFDMSVYKVAAMNLQWALIQRAMQTIFGEVKFYE
jgi:hypothetical protein